MLVLVRAKQVGGNCPGNSDKGAMKPRSLSGSIKFLGFVDSALKAATLSSLLFLFNKVTTIYSYNSSIPIL